MEDATADRSSPAPAKTTKDFAEALPRAATRKPRRIQKIQGKKKRSYLPAEERKRRIILAAKEVFSRTSLQGARTRELAKAAQVNQATLFEHFASKEELFVAAVVQPLLDVMRGMRERAQAYKAAATLEDMLDLAKGTCHRHLETMVEIYPLLIAALFSDPALGKKLYQQQIAPLLKERANTTRSLFKGVIDSDLLSLASFGIFFAVAMDRHFTGKTTELSVTAGKITDLIGFGLTRNRTKARGKPKSARGKNGRKA